MQYQVSIVRELIYGAVEYGADFQELCRRMQVTPEILANGEGMLAWSPDPEKEFWANAVRMTGDQQLGLHLGQHETPRIHFGMLGMLAKTCKTLGDAIRAICAYNDTVSTVLKYSLIMEGQTAVLSLEPLRLWEIHHEDSARQAVDMSLSGFCKQFYQVTGNLVVPSEVQIKYNERARAEYERLLRAPVTFHSPRNAILLKRSDLEAPLISYDQSLFTVFDALLRQKQVLMAEQSTLTQRIRHLLVREFRGHIPSIDIIASHLSMTPRTLQRKLADENTSFREISLQLRKELAAELMRSGAAGKKQIANILGYADTDTLRRALKA